MTDFNADASITVEPSTPFCARTYFRGLREAGARPYARSHAGRDASGLCLDDGVANVRARPWHRWALQQDPDRVQRRAYVLALLDKHRHTEVDLVTIQLGICDDEIEPKVVRIPSVDGAEFAI